MRCRHPAHPDPSAGAARRLVIFGGLILGLIGAVVGIQVQRSARPDPTGLTVVAARQVPATDARARARSEVKIVMYSTSWCGYCKKARAFFEREGYGYSDYDIDVSPSAAERMRAINPRGGVPVLDIDGQVEVGFDPRSTMALIERGAAARAR